MQDRSGNTALIWAVKTDNLRIVQELLDHTADVDLKNNDGENPLMLATRLGNTEIIDELQERRVSKKQIDTLQRKGKLKTIKNFLEPVVVEHRQEEGDTTQNKSTLTKGYNKK